MDRPGKRRGMAASAQGRLGLLLVGLLALGQAALACEGQVGRGPFSVAGQVVDETGQPVAGLRLAWLPLLPGSAQPDFDNLYYAIQERTDHETATGPDGRFAMTEVRDYYLVPSHQYFIWGLDVLADPVRQPYWRVTGEIVDLNRTPPTALEVNLVARPAGALRLRVTTPDGRPFDGTLPVAFDRPEREGDDLVLNRRFVAGECVQGGLEPGPVRVRLLSGPVAEELKFKNFLTYPPAAGRPVTLVAGEDVRVEAAATVEAGQTGEVSLVLQ